jgi:hypothetical protein
LDIVTPNPSPLTGDPSNAELGQRWRPQTFAVDIAPRFDCGREPHEAQISVDGGSEKVALTGEQIGNFLQAFTHLRLIDAALSLNDALDRGVAPAG